MFHRVVTPWIHHCVTLSGWRAWSSWERAVRREERIMLSPFCPKCSGNKSCRALCRQQSLPRGCTDLWLGFHKSLVGCSTSHPGSLLLPNLSLVCVIGVQAAHPPCAHLSRSLWDIKAVSHCSSSPQPSLSLALWQCFPFSSSPHPPGFSPFSFICGLV